MTRASLKGLAPARKERSSLLCKTHGCKEKNKQQDFCSQFVWKSSSSVFICILHSVPTFLELQLYFESRFLSGIMSGTQLFGKHWCGCLIIRAQTYCVLQEVGKQLILKTIHNVDHRLLVGSLPTLQTWLTLLMSFSNPAPWAELESLCWQLSEGCWRNQL